MNNIIHALICLTNFVTNRSKFRWVYQKWVGSKTGPACVHDTAYKFCLIIHMLEYFMSVHVFMNILRGRMIYFNVFLFQNILDNFGNPNLLSWNCLYKSLNKVTVNFCRLPMAVSEKKSKLLSNVGKVASGLIMEPVTEAIKLYRLHGLIGGIFHHLL